MAEETGGGGGGGAVSAGAPGLPPLSFDAAALAQIERRGTLLPGPQLPAAVAAVYASLAAAPEAEAALEAEYQAAIRRREEAEAERDMMLKRVVPLRRFVPTASTDEMLADLRNETSKRQQLEAEFRSIKGRIEEVAHRIGRMQDHAADAAAQHAGPLKPVHYRWMAGVRPVIPPGAAMQATVEEIGRTAAALHQKLSIGIGARGDHNVTAPHQDV